jgi:hypothetical protein
VKKKKKTTNQKKTVPVLSEKEKENGKTKKLFLY